MVSFHSQVSRFPPDHLGHASSNTLGRAQVLLLLLEKVKVVMKSQYKTEKNDNEQELFTRSLFVELGEASETGKTQCCPIRCHNHPLVVQVQIIISQVVSMIPIFRLKTGVQIVGGVLAILSGVLLVLFFAKLDEVGTTSFLFGHVWKQYKL